MAIGEVCNREVIVARIEDSVLEAARLMRQYHVGNVVVIEERGDVRVPVGIVTDRDVVVEVVAPGLDPATITVGDIMVSRLATVKESAGVFDTIRYMREKGVRRVPVVKDDGSLAGIVTLDDLLALLAEELDAFAKLMKREQERESAARC